MPADHKDRKLLAFRCQRDLLKDAHFSDALNPHDEFNAEFREPSTVG